MKPIPILATCCVKGKASQSELQRGDLTGGVRPDSVPAKLQFPQIAFPAFVPVRPHALVEMPEFGTRDESLAVGVVG